VRQFSVRGVYPHTGDVRWLGVDLLHDARSTHRRVVELIQSGAIGRVYEAHATIGGDRGGGERPTDTPPVPAHLKWDLWLGPRPWRPYHPDIWATDTFNKVTHAEYGEMNRIPLLAPLLAVSAGPPLVIPPPRQEAVR